MNSRSQFKTQIILVLVIAAFNAVDAFTVGGYRPSSSAIYHSSLLAYSGDATLSQQRLRLKDAFDSAQVVFNNIMPDTDIKSLIQASSDLYTQGIKRHNIAVTSIVTSAANSIESNSSISQMKEIIEQGMQTVMSTPALRARQRFMIAFLEKTGPVVLKLSHDVTLPATTKNGMRPHALHWLARIVKKQIFSALMAVFISLLMMEVMVTNDQQLLQYLKYFGQRYLFRVQVPKLP